MLTNLIILPSRFIFWSRRLTKRSLRVDQLESTKRTTSNGRSIWLRELLRNWCWSECYGFININKLGMAISETFIYMFCFKGGMVERGFDQPKYIQKLRWSQENLFWSEYFHFRQWAYWFGMAIWIWNIVYQLIELFIIYLDILIAFWFTCIIVVSVLIHW